VGCYPIGRDHVENYKRQSSRRISGGQGVSGIAECPYSPKTCVTDTPDYNFSINFNFQEYRFLGCGAV
jgi:hypothetical protein